MIKRAKRKTNCIRLISNTCVTSLFSINHRMILNLYAFIALMYLDHFYYFHALFKLMVLLMNSSLNTKLAKSIINSIENHVSDNSPGATDYSQWYCGVTNKPSVRQSGHKSKRKTNTLYWKSFDAKTKTLALDIEKYFHEKGMLDKHTVGYTVDTTKFVYVYMLIPKAKNDIHRLIRWIFS